MTDIVKLQGLPQEQLALLESLQGILNRKGKRVFVDVDWYAEYLPQTEPLRHVTTEELLRDNVAEFCGCVVYDLDSSDISINMAATISAAYDILALPRKLLPWAQKYKLRVLADLAEVKGSSAQRQQIIFDYCLPRLNKNGLVHQVVKKDNFHLRLRDFAISQRFAIVYTDESDSGRTLRKYILEKLNDNIPIYGWNDDEIAFIKDISEHGNYAIPTDWSANHSYFVEEKAIIKQQTKRTALLPNKHYVAFVVSDGDNVQWLERDFAQTHIFAQRQQSTTDYKMSWTFSPSLLPTCKPAVEKIFHSQKQDYFISGVSGIGYANCLSYPRNKLDTFTEQTAQAMKQSDLSVVCLLDNINLTTDKDFVTDRLHSYARFENIRGGIWELDPDRYGSGRGKIFWSDGKPFVSVRFTMWHPSGNAANVTKQWLDEFVAQLNEMPVSPNSAEGYSVVNVHPWTVSAADVDYVVSKLNSHLQLVFADELVELVKQNISQQKNI